MMRTLPLIRSLGLLFFTGITLTGCVGQGGEDANNGRASKDPTSPVGGPFENSEFTYYGIPRIISPTDTSPGWKQNGQKILLTGTILQPDGRTPAPGVLLYYYHTNVEGRYRTDPHEARNMPPNELGQTHGCIRGWVRSDSSGTYRIYTVRPGTYPTRDEPAHIHATIKEPNDVNEYYIDDLVFDDDPILTSQRRRKMENRGGSGVLRLVQQGDLLVGERDIYLGRNIPGHPAHVAEPARSGPDIGEDVHSFTPYHAWGPDMGTKTCPVCKYGWYHGILYFVGNRPDRTAIAAWLRFLEDESRKRDKYLKAYFIYGNEQDYDRTSRSNELEQLGRSLALERVALTFVPSLTDTASEVHLNHIDPNAVNTLILYKRSKVIANFIDLEPTKTSFAMVRQALDASINEYYDLPKPAKE